MATKTEKSPQPAAETAEKTAEKAERKIPLENLRRSCVKLFGVSFSTFDGATVGLSGKYTVNEMRDIIDAWLRKEVK